VGFATAETFFAQWRASAPAAYASQSKLQLLLRCKPGDQSWVCAWDADLDAVGHVLLRNDTIGRIGMGMGFRHKLNMVANLLECTERLIHIGRNLAICLECLSGSRNFDSFQVRREFSTSFCSANLLSFNRGR
jgi:hypothetical protein